MKIVDFVILLLLVFLIWWIVGVDLGFINPQALK